MLSFVKSLTPKQKQAILLLIDSTLIPVAYLLSLTILFGLSGAATTLMSTWTSLLILLVLAAGASYLLGVSKVRLNAYESVAMLKTAIFTLFLIPALFLIEMFEGLRLEIGVYVVFGLLFFILSVSSRLVLQQLLLSLYRRSQKRVRILIYGAGRTGMQLALALKQHDTIDAVAFVDDNQLLHGMFVSGLRVKPASKIRSLAEKHKIDRVLLAMPSVSLPKQSRISRQLADMGLEVQSLPSEVVLLFRPVSSQFKMDQVFI